MTREDHPVIRWSEFRSARPLLAQLGSEMLYSPGLGIGFFATVRHDGGPRLHPVCPVLARGLYVFVLPGPKLADLRRDGRYSLHSETFPPPRHDDAFSISGVAVELDEPELRAELTQQFCDERDLAEPWPGFEEQVLVELHIDRALVTLTSPRDGVPAGHTVWRA